MPTEYAYPEQLGLGDQTLQVVICGLALAIFFLPLAREIFRPGPMNWLDVGLGSVCIIAAFCVPRAIETNALTRLPAALQIDIASARQIWASNTWKFACGLAGFAVMIHGCWLLTCALKSYKVQRTMAVYLLPFSTCCFPSLGHPRYIHDFYSCRNHLKQVLLALHNDENTRAGLVPAVLNADSQPRSWRVELLPYLDHAPLRKSYDATQPWDASPNEAFSKRKIEPLICPANYRPKNAAGRYYTAFAGVVGPNTLFDPDGHIRTFKDVTDGTSNTIAFVEACGANIVWTEPRDLPLDDVEMGVNPPGPQPGTSRGVISSCHFPKRGGHVGFLDGTVRFVSEDVDAQLLKKLLTADGGEMIPREDSESLR